MCNRRRRTRIRVGTTLSLPKCGLDKHLQPSFHGPWWLRPPFSRTVKWERMHTQASYNRWLWTIHGGTILRMLRRYLTKVVGIANIFPVCFPISRSSSPDSGFNLNTNLGSILRVVVGITFFIILSGLLINLVHRESKSNSLGKRYILSISINVKKGPHINIIVACCPFRSKHQHRCPRGLPVCIISLSMYSLL